MLDGSGEGFLMLLPKHVTRHVQQAKPCRRYYNDSESSLTKTKRLEKSKLEGLGLGITVLPKSPQPYWGSPKFEILFGSPLDRNYSSSGGLYWGPLSWEATIIPLYCTCSALAGRCLHLFLRPQTTDP